MRNMEFRTYDILHGRMVYDVVPIRDMPYIEDDEEIEQDIIKLIPLYPEKECVYPEDVHIMINTWRTTISGHMIWESDIVIVKSPDNINKQYIVELNEDNDYFQLVSFDKQEIIPAPEWNKYIIRRIVGNIYTVDDPLIQAYREKV